MKRLLLALAFAAFAAPASATLQLSATLNGISIFCADQQACDTNPVVNQLAIADQTVGGIRILGSSQIAFAGPDAFISTSSFQISNLNFAAALVTLAISGTDFFGPATAFEASGSGTWQQATGSNLVISYFGDAANTQGADNSTDLPGVQLTSFADAALIAADSFSFNDSGAFNAPNPFYSLSLGTSGTLAGWNQVPGFEPTLVGRSQTLLVTPLQVPEPGTLALVGLALFGLGFMRLRKA